MPDLPLGVQPEPLIPEPAPPEPEPPAPKDPHRRLLDDLKKSKEKYRTLELAAVAAGVDPTDPASFIAKREAAEKAKADRELRVRDAVKDYLLDAGTKLDRKLRDVIIQGAVGDASVTIDETGKPCGISQYVAAWTETLKKGGPNLSPISPGPMSPSPGLPPIGRADGDAGRAGPKEPSTFTDLTKQGAAAVEAYRKRDPARYAELHAAHLEALRHPTRTQLPTK